MKRKREEGDGNVNSMDIVWQTPANPPEARDYIVRNGRRHVRPYYFEFIAHVKNRWAGKTIVDLFAEEFKGRPYEYYVNAVECGRIQVDGEMVPVSYIVKSSQKISHFVHRHEPPVMASGVSVLQKEPDVVTVWKPASVPLLHRSIHVVNIQTVDAKVNYNAREGRSTVEVKDSPKGKAACTKFSRISSNGTYSIVLCEPVTGRTHQIRVHLQYLGHPIANDTLYLSEETVDRSSKGSSFDEKVLNEYEGDSHGDFSIDPMCTNCPDLAPKGYDGLDEGLWLHCFRYSGPGWTYECPYPDWAKL